METSEDCGSTTLTTLAAVGAVLSCGQFEDLLMCMYATWDSGL